MLAIDIIQFQCHNQLIVPSQFGNQSKQRYYVVFLMILLRYFSLRLNQSQQETTVSCSLLQVIINLLGLRFGHREKEMSYLIPHSRILWKQGPTTLAFSLHQVTFHREERFKLNSIYPIECARTESKEHRTSRERKQAVDRISKSIDFQQKNQQRKRRASKAKSENSCNRILTAQRKPLVLNSCVQDFHEHEESIYFTSPRTTSPGRSIKIAALKPANPENYAKTCRKNRLRQDLKPVDRSKTLNTVSDLGLYSSSFNPAKKTHHESFKFRITELPRII